MKEPTMKVSFSGFTRFAVLFLISILMLESIACANLTLTGSINHATYTFEIQNKKYKQINPFTPYQRDYVHPIVDTSNIDKRGDSHISVNVYNVDESIRSAHDAINYFTKIEAENKTTSTFFIKQSEYTALSGIKTEYISYSISYRSIPEIYEGLFASFQYETYIVEISLLFPNADETSHVFDLLVKTFKINNRN